MASVAGVNEKSESAASRPVCDCGGLRPSLASRCVYGVQRPPCDRRAVFRASLSLSLCACVCVADASMIISFFSSLPLSHLSMKCFRFFTTTAPLPVTPVPRPIVAAMDDGVGRHRRNEKFFPLLCGRSVSSRFVVAGSKEEKNKIHCVLPRATRMLPLRLCPNHLPHVASTETLPTQSHHFCVIIFFLFFVMSYRLFFPRCVAAHIFFSFVSMRYSGRARGAGWCMPRSATYTAKGATMTATTQA